MCGNMGSGGSGGSSSTNSSSPIMQASSAEKDQIRQELSRQFYDNYDKFGLNGEKANNLIIEEFKKDGVIDNDIAQNLQNLNTLIKQTEQMLQRQEEKRNMYAEKNSKIDKKASERNKRAYEKKLAERESAKQKQEALKQRNKEREQWREETNKMINEARKNGTLSRLLGNDKTAGMNPTLPAVTSTYKRSAARRRRRSNAV